MTSEQAKTLPPLWQTLFNLAGSETTAEAEQTALQDHDSQTLTSVQLQAIASVQITNANLNALYAENNIFLPAQITDITKVPNSQLSRV